MQKKTLSTEQEKAIIPIAVMSHSSDIISACTKYCIWRGRILDLKLEPITVLGHVIKLVTADIRNPSRRSGQNNIVQNKIGFF